MQIVRGLLAFLLVGDGLEGRDEADLGSAEDVCQVSHWGLEGAHEAGNGGLKLSEDLRDEDILGRELGEAVDLLRASTTFRRDSRR